MTADDPLLPVRAAQVYYRYARAVDDGDLDALRALVTDDVRTTRGDREPESGVEVFLDIYRAHNALGIPVCKHVISNVQAEQVGSEIRTHAYFEATFLEEEGTRVVIGVYEDVLVELDGELRISHKKIRTQRVLHLPAASVRFVRAEDR